MMICAFIRILRLFYLYNYLYNSKYICIFIYDFKYIFIYNFREHDFKYFKIKNLAF